MTLDHSSDKSSFNVPSKPISTFNHCDLNVICSGKIPLSKKGIQIANASGNCEGQAKFRRLRRGIYEVQGTVDPIPYTLKEMTHYT
jgi:hypothetical protein